MKKDVIVYFISKVIIGLIGLIILKLYSTMISPAEYGEYSLISSLITAIISVFIGWIGSSALRYFDEYKENKKTFFTNITIFYVLMLFICFLILFICNIFMKNISMDKYIINILFFTTTIALTDILEKVLRASNKAKVYALSSVLQSLLSIIAFYIFVKYFNLGIESIFESSIISKAIFALIALIAVGYIIDIKNIKIDKNILKKFLSYGIPMIGVWGIGWILHYCDRYIISMFINNYEVGVYDMSCKISENTINLLISSFTLSIFPVLIRDWNQGGIKVIEEKVKNVIKYYNLLILPAIIGLIVIVDKLYLGLIDPQYMGGKFVIIIICIGTYINGFNSILNKLWQLNEKTKNIFNILLVSVVINIILNFIFIPHFGINAAALTTLVSYIVSIVITYILVKKDMKIIIDIKSLIKTTLSCIGMSIFLIICNPYVQNIFVLIIEILAAAIVYFVLNILLKNIDLSFIEK